MNLHRTLPALAATAAIAAVPATASAHTAMQSCGTVNSNVQNVRIAHGTVAPRYACYLARTFAETYDEYTVDHGVSPSQARLNIEGWRSDWQVNLSRWYTPKGVNSYRTITARWDGTTIQWTNSLGDN
jgi:hypothetical protein